MIFHLVNTRYLIQTLKKDYNDDKIDKSLWWLKNLITNKDTYLKLLEQ